MEILLRQFQQQADFPFFVQYGHHEEEMPYHRHHDFHELVFVLGGSAAHRVNGVVYPIAKGDVFAITGTTSHGFEAPHELKIFNILYRDSVLGQVADDLRRLPGYQALFVVEPLLRQQSGFEAKLRIGGERLGQMEATLAALEAEHAAKAPGWTAAAVGLFLEILVRVSRWYQESPPLDRFQPLHLARGFARLEAEFHRPLLLEEVAADQGVSVRHFRRLFRQSYGLSPHQFVVHRRIRLACDLLEKTDLPLAEVALRCGFADQGHLGRQFKKSLGCPPGLYRSRGKRG